MNRFLRFCKEPLLVFRVLGPRLVRKNRNKTAWILRIAQFNKYLKRRKAVQSFEENTDYSIPEGRGFRRLNSIKQDRIDNVLESSNRHWSRFDLEESLAERNGKPFVALSLGKHLKQGDPILEYALSPEVLSAVSKYIGMVPVIENIVIWYSPNDIMLDNSSQYYHYDGQDVRTVQMFMLLDDVALENGPLTVVRADESEKLADKIKYRKTAKGKRLLDRVVDDFVSESCTKFTGSAGDVLIADTDRCFHLGSREGTKPRRVLVVQYYSPFAFVLPRKWDEVLPLVHLAQCPGFTQVEKMVLGLRA